MKIIEEWEDGNYKVIIKAEFVTNGIDIRNYMCIPTDLVRVEAIILYHGEQIDGYLDNIYEGKYYESRLFGKKKYVKTLEANYNMAIDEIKKIIGDKIVQYKRNRSMELSDKQITDGLPDSLKGM